MPNRGISVYFLQLECTKANRLLLNVIFFFTPLLTIRRRYLLSNSIEGYMTIFALMLFFTVFRLVDLFYTNNTVRCAHS